MATPRVLILRAPGTNCDQETAFAFQRSGAESEILHVNRLLEAPRRLADFQILCVPGGFSYGDDLAAGRILASHIRRRLAEELREFKAAGKLILGICNGFQVLIKSGVLLADDEQGMPATLTMNESGKYEDRWVNLIADGSKCVFLQGISALTLPLAHAEGKFVARSAAILGSLDSAGQLVLRYARSDGQPGNEVPYPQNPSGSQANVAGVCDPSGRVFGLMPHPERYMDRTQHPRWTRGEGHDPGDGLRIFENAVRYLR
jgi:phosphoribosylformylglycinamidine synthase